ncbi:MAG: hypothetical protein NC301_02115 [Bacteroides sp.]|nr:hypothetical protein [Bacteroides sp.]MCM1379060.1 hypothetical protein [Bacteroides sp.]MCM1445758.1 hypothetical protein [Prevotella sp.]
MKRTLTKAEMLTLWRYARTAEPLRLDCTVARTEGADFDAMLTEEMRAWYLTQLDEAPEELLAPEELASEAQVSGVYGVTHVKLPQRVRRILRVRFSEWPGAVVPDENPATLRRLAANPYCQRPMAARISPRELIVCAPRGSLSSVIAITDPGSETYIFDDRLLVATE